MKCEKCGGKMMIAGSKLISEEGSTDVYSEMKMVCINPKCDDYGGRDLNKATKFQTLRRKAN